jgi:Iap family predicted aminopeptidase
MLKLIVAKYLMTGKFSLFLHVGGSLDPAKATSHPPKFDMIFEIDETIKHAVERQTKYKRATIVGSMERAEFVQLRGQCLRTYNTQQQNWTTGIVEILKSDPQKYPHIVRETVESIVRDSTKTDTEVTASAV